MKSAIVSFLLLTTTAFAQVPDPADSIIIESKYAAPKNGACQSAVLRVRVYITNKDSLGNVTLPFLFTSKSGGAYATLSRPANCSSDRAASATVFDFIYPDPTRLPTRATNSQNYHSNSPDSFPWSGNLQIDQELLPNSTRTPFLEIKFDTVRTNLGTFEIDTTRIGFSSPVFVTLLGGAVIPFNFVKSTITVRINGDMNLDGLLTSPDVVLILNCVFLGMISPAGAGACDVNCDGMPTPADVVDELNGVFLGMAFPCQ